MNQPADMEFQLAFEKLFNKNQLIPRLRNEFNLPEIISILEEHEIPIKFGLDLLVQMSLHKRTKIIVLVGLLIGHFKDEEEPAQECVNMLKRAAEADLVDYSMFRNEFIVVYNITQDIQDELDQYQFPLPCLVPPKLLKNNMDTGYHSFPVNTGSVLLKKGNHHDDDVCLDHLNKMNQTAMTINTEVARLIKNQWRNLDKPKEGEDQKKYQARVKAFEKYDKASHDVMQHVYMAGNIFYLTHKYDKRGRCYSQGYHVNTQGNPWNKAVVEFAHQEIANG